MNSYDAYIRGIKKRRATVRRAVAKVLAEHEGRDVRINYTRHYWIDGEHKALEMKDLRGLMQSPRAMLDRIRSMVEIPLNDDIHGG